VETHGRAWRGHRGCGLGVGAVTPASGSSAGNQTIRVTALFTEFDPNIDVGATGFSFGDEVVFSGDLVQGRQQVGRVGVVCTFVSTANAARVEAQCPATATLPDGQIAIQGVIVNRSLNFTLPITGGSGAYDKQGDKSSLATFRRRPSPWSS